MILRVLLCLCALFAGCADGSGTLDGSLGSVYRLGFDDVRARLYSSELAIEYASGDGAVPVRVTLRRGALPDEPTGSSWSLVDDGDITGQLADGTYIPRFTTGRVSIGSFELREGSRIEGSFTGTFDLGRDSLGINGTFNVPLVLVTAPSRPEGVPIPEE